jgi:hypothetical protein
MTIPSEPTFPSSTADTASLAEGTDRVLDFGMGGLGGVAGGERSKIDHR